MKIFTNKGMIRKVATILVVLMLFNFILPMPGHISHADGGDGGVGGALFRPILDFLVGISDWIISFIQQSIFGIQDSFIHVDRSSNWWGVVLGIIAAITAIAVCVVLAVVCEVASAGTATPFVVTFLGVISAGLSKAALVVGGLTFVGVVYANSQNLPDDFELPMIQITPESIFSRGNSGF